MTMFLSWKMKNQRMGATMHRRRRMEKWVEANGGINEEADRRAVAGWLEKNKVTVCPPFRHRSADYDD